MADRVSASITIGGAINATEHDELCRLIADEGLSIEWDGEPFEPADRVPGQSLYLCAHQVAGGFFEALESWCVEQDIPFARHSDAYPGQWDAERVVFTGAGEPVSYAVGEDGRALVDRQTVEGLATIEGLRDYFDAADFRVPPLVVEDH